MFYVDNSAKVVEYNEVTPLSNYVNVYNDGSCEWQPRYELSISQCSIVETWFPFDEQTCELVFYSWLLTYNQLDFFPFIDNDTRRQYIESDEWELTGT